MLEKMMTLTWSGGDEAKWLWTMLTRKCTSKNYIDCISQIWGPQKGVKGILSIIVNLDRKSEDWFWGNLQYSPLGAAGDGQRQAFLIVWSCFHRSAHLNFLSSCFQEASEGFLKMHWFKNKLFVGNILKILSYRFCPISNYLPFWFPHFD